MMLSVTHQRGHGVAVVVDIQARHLASRGYEVLVAGPSAPQEMPYVDCRRVVLDSAEDAACAAVENSVDCIVAHTPPFFSTARWLGGKPRFFVYDYGEPNPQFFPDAEARLGVLAEKAFCSVIADRWLAISPSVAGESGLQNVEVVPLGNAHLAVWSLTMPSEREKARALYGWADKFVVLNVCRFHRAERHYKGVDTYVRVRDLLRLGSPSLGDKIVFVMCGKTTEEDVAEIESTGLTVLADVSDSELVQLYAAADLYVNFSRWEGYNLGIGQALAMGLPVFASDIPPHKAFPIATFADVDEAVDRIIDLADDTLSATQPASRESVVFPWDASLRRFEQIIVEELGRKDDCSCLGTNSAELR